MGIFLERKRGIMCINLPLDVIKFLIEDTSHFV